MLTFLGNEDGHQGGSVGSGTSSAQGKGQQRDAAQRDIGLPSRESFCHREVPHEPDFICRCGHRIFSNLLVIASCSAHGIVWLSRLSTTARKKNEPNRFASPSKYRSQVAELIDTWRRPTARNPPQLCLYPTPYPRPLLRSAQVAWSEGGATHLPFLQSCAPLMPHHRISLAHDSGHGSPSFPGIAFPSGSVTKLSSW